ncbi:serine protease 38-like isoform X2 [Convolutriloba macropyga]|uniref:serine protease 38-like isoform X2 n=1 Tax=Convolutriloba macropyga TaxID=536237 RepID=UPI003F5253B1
MPGSYKRTAVQKFNLTTNSNDVALIQLNRPAPASRILRICSTSAEYGTVVATCGLGSTSRVSVSPSESLQELFLRETLFSFTGLFAVEFCPVDQLCMEPVAKGGSICNLDEGGPLYKLSCESRIPECVLGVASYYTVSDNPEINCNGDSIFASVSYHFRWISSIISTGLPIN